MNIRIVPIKLITEYFFILLSMANYFVKYLKPFEIALWSAFVSQRP